MLSLAALSDADPGTSGYDDSCEHPEASHGRLSAHVRVPPMSEGTERLRAGARRRVPSVGARVPALPRRRVQVPAGRLPRQHPRLHAQRLHPRRVRRRDVHDIEWCQLYGRPLEYACWEIAGSEANATMTFGRSSATSAGGAWGSRACCRTTRASCAAARTRRPPGAARTRRPIPGARAAASSWRGRGGRACSRGRRALVARQRRRTSRRPSRRRHRRRRRRRRLRRRPTTGGSGRRARRRARC